VADDVDAVMAAMKRPSSNQPLDPACVHARINQLFVRDDTVLCRRQSAADAGELPLSSDVNVASVPLRLIRVTCRSLSDLIVTRNAQVTSRVTETSRTGFHGLSMHDELAVAASRNQVGT
jgi:hypothetical protein